MGFGATPHRGNARGAAPHPASFLKRKRERRISRKRRFRRGNYRFLGKCASAWRKNMRFSGNTFPLGKENKSFCGSAPLGKKSGFKIKLHLSKTLLIPHQKFLGFLSPFFKMGLNGGWGNAPQKEARGAAPYPASFLKRKRGKKKKPKTPFSAGD